MRNLINRGTVGLISALVGAAGYWLATSHFAASFFAMVAVVLCAETRVRMGFRLEQRPSMALHILVGVLLLLALGALALGLVPVAAAPVAGLLLLLVALGGGSLLVRQYIKFG